VIKFERVSNDMQAVRTFKVCTFLRLLRRRTWLENINDISSQTTIARFFRSSNDDDDEVIQNVRVRIFLYLDIMDRNRIACDILRFFSLE